MDRTNTGLHDAFPAWWRVARQWFTGGTRWQARLYVLACTGLALVTTWLAVQISYTQKRFSTGLAERDKGAWLAAVWEFVGIICLAAPLKALTFYMEKRLIAVWRSALTEAFIAAYTNNRAYFHLQLARGTEGDSATGSCSGKAADAAGHETLLAASTQRDDTSLSVQPFVGGLSSASACVDNPDQRVTADVANFVSTSVSLVLLLAKKLMNCAAFAGVLWSISPRLVTFLVCYAFMGTFGTAFFFGRPLASLQQRVLRLEADLRFGLVRLRENAEAIAFYSGDAEEAADLSKRLAAMIDVLLKRIRWLGVYELWVHTYSYATILIPSLVLAPEYFAGKVEFGTLTQASYAFTVLEGALGLILAKIDEFSSLTAETVRLAGLLAALEAADVDAGGSGLVPGFEAADSSHMLLSLERVLRFKQRKSGTKTEPWHTVSTAANISESNEDAEGAQLLTVVTGSSRVVRPGRGSSSSGCSTGGTSRDEQSHAEGRQGSVSRVLRLMEGTFSGLSVENLTAYVPGRHHSPTCICKETTFSVGAGESLLVMGPSGCGKSSLLRVIAGLWTVGGGTICGPSPDRVFFLPQKPFMPIGTLRRQLLFPTRWQKQLIGQTACSVQHGDLHLGRISNGQPDSCAIIVNDSSSMDQQLQELLQAVKLGHLLHRFELGLDADVDWASVLSLGEQQRVALVRLLYHKPDLAFLDEATAGLDAQTEAIVYNMVASSCSSYVSIGHRPQLLDWHTHVLVFNEQGSWLKYTVADYKERRVTGLAE